MDIITISESDKKNNIKAVDYRNMCYAFSIIILFHIQYMHTCTHINN